MDLQEIKNYQILSNQVWNDNEVQSALKEWYEILKRVKETWNNDLYNKFKQEYIDLEKSIQEAIKNDKKISKEERIKIMSELTDIVLLAENEKIGDETNLWNRLVSKVWDYSKGTNTKIEYSKISNFLNKDINSSDWNYETVKKALDYTNKIYTSKPDWKIWYERTSLSELTDKKDINIFQGKLIEKTFWKGHNGYDSQWNIMWFSKEKWNYIKSLSEVEKRLKTDDLQNISNVEIRNYLNYLNGNNKLKKEHLTKTYWDKKSKETLDFVVRNNSVKENPIWFWNIDKITQILKDFWETVVQTVEKVKKTISDFFNKILESKTPQELEKNLQKSSNLNPEEKKEIISKLANEWEKKNSQLKLMIFNSLPKILSKEKKEKLIEELINNINSNLTPEKLWNVFKIIHKFNEKNHATLDEEKTVKKSLETQQVSNTHESTKISFKLGDYTKQLEQAKKSWNINLIDELTRKLQELTKSKKQNDLNTSSTNATQRILSQMTTPQIQAVANWTLNYSTVLSNIRKKDTDLNKQLKNIEKSQKEFDQKYPEEKQKREAKDNIQTHPQNIEPSSTQATTFSYTDGTQVSYTQTTPGLYSLNTPTGTKIEMNSQELTMVLTNKNALNNMIDFKKTLDELWLSKLWKYKENIFKTLENPMTFNSKDDFINKNEFNTFLKTILKSIGIASNSDNIETTKLQFITENNVSVLWWAEVNGMYNRTNIEQRFFQEYIDLNTWFLDWKLRKNIKINS